MLRDSSPPAETRLTICHTGRGPNRNTHALAATATASNASATTLHAGSDRSELGIQRDRAPCEQHPDLLSPPDEPAQPATHRVRRHPQP